MSLDFTPYLPNVTRATADEGIIGWPKSVPLGTKEQLEAGLAPIDTTKLIGVDLAHPSRTHYSTVDFPKKRIPSSAWSEGVPRPFLVPFAHFLRACAPVEQARANHLLCTAKHAHMHPKHCVNEAVELFQITNAAVEEAFETCPRQSANYVECYHRTRHNKDCRPEQASWEKCIS